MKDASLRYLQLAVVGGSDLGVEGAKEIDGLQTSLELLSDSPVATSYDDCHSKR